MSGMVDVEGLRAWIGRSETAEDTVTPRMVREYAAMMDVAAAEEAPLALHWCLAPAAARASELGADGHPAKGRFLPPVPLPRRMWAGGELRFHGRLAVGDAVRRRSEIADVTVKEGRTGVLCFVTVRHEIFGPRGLAVSERQDLVYREAASGPVAKPGPDDVPAPQWRRSGKADPVLLFRYSALTFNGHRIHYDRNYAMGAENYRGLVVHGPLQATWLLEFAAAIKGAAPADFSFRGVSPLFDFEGFEVCAVESGDGLELWIATGDGVKTMTARARW